MQRVRSVLAALALALPVVGVAAPVATADSPNAAVGFGRLYHDGEVVRTVVTPTSTPGKGVDQIFSFADGVEGQLSVT
ncbi:MAG: hypothetical protein ACRDVZ_10825, partial [Jiangellaceae bacterium]